MLDNVLKFPHLEDLILSNTRVTDGELGKLRHLNELHSLELESTNVGDRCLDWLGGTRLENLVLSNTNISDCCISSIIGVKSLKFLDITNTSITEEGRMRIEESLPDALISWGQ